MSSIGMLMCRCNSCRDTLKKVLDTYMDHDTKHIVNCGKCGHAHEVKDATEKVRCPKCNEPHVDAMPVIIIDE